MPGAAPNEPRDQQGSVHNELRDVQAAVQARDVHGDIHVYPSAPAVAQPPPVQYPNPWAEQAGTHKVWECTTDADDILPAVVDTATSLHDRWQELAARLEGDPWLDPEFATRMSTTLTELISKLAQPMTFRPVEAALLVLTPLAHQVWLLESAVELLDVGPTDLRPRARSGSRHDYERFLTEPEQSRLVNRAELTHLDGRGGPAARDAIGWWLFHQWVRSLPRDPVTHSLPVDDPTFRKVLVSTTKKLTHLFRFTPDQLRDGDNRRHLRAVATHPGVTDDVDEERLGFLLVVAHEQAIDLMRLPATLVEHLGIPRPVDLSQLATTIRHARWKPTDTGIGLVAHCEHEAVLESLRDHVDHTTAVLAAVHAVATKAANLEPLRRLPAVASADFVEPALDDDNQPVITVPVTRFRLDETRVRELLMGEQLYGDKSLAIRELYQNALDACRWRRARYASGEPGQPREWTGGRIDFEQKVENGRHILRCTDTGVGMGESDLREVFSRAGVRFTERREFREEEAGWEAKDVRFFPNSRFGIGVLSYFMLADEIEVRTRRMNRDGGSEPALRVLIAGPGHLFHIEPLDGEQPIGTSVTLYLRDGSTAPSCREVLRRLLGIAEFDTRVTHDNVPEIWRRAEFEVRTHRTAQSDGINVTGAVVLGDPTEDGQVVWCENGGGLLVDGIHVDLPDKKDHLGEVQITEINGAIVNLTGLMAPRLTVNRAKVREDVTHQISALMSAAVPRLLQAGPSFLTLDWLYRVANATRAVADALTSAAAAAGLRITTFGDNDMDMRTTGFLPVDRLLVSSLSERDVARHPMLVWSDVELLSDHVLLWRLLAHRGNRALIGFAADVPDVLPALPTDELLLDWADLDDTTREKPRIPPGHVVTMAFAKNADPAVVVNRIAVLGHDVSGLDSLPARRSLVPTDVTLLSRDLDGEKTWLDPTTPVPLGHVIAAHRTTRIPVLEIVRRLREYSFRIQHPVEKISHFTYQDEFLVSVDIDGRWPWLDHGDHVSRRHVFLAASVLRRKVPDVVGRLKELGFDDVAPVERLPDWLADSSPVTTTMLRKNPVLRTDGTVAPSWVAYAAAQWQIPPREAMQRLTDLSYPVSEDDELPDRLDERDTVLLTYLFESTGISQTLSVPFPVLCQTAKRVTRPPSAVAARLAALGFDVPPEEALAHELDDADRWLLENIATAWTVGENPRHALTPVIDAARMFDASLDSLSKRLRRLGYADLVSSSLRPGWSLPLAFVLDTANRTNSPPNDVLTELFRRGFPITPPTPPVHWFDAVNTKLVKDLGPGMNVSVRDVLRAALKYDMTIADVIDRLSGLGLEVPDMATELPALLARVPFRTT